MGDAIDGVGAFAGASEAVRREAVRIGVRDQIMVAWAIHELDAAVDKAAKGSFTKKSGAPHNWDEVWAYYHGEKPECSPFATANARGEEFGVGTLITRRLVLSMKDGLKALAESKSASSARKVRDDVMRDFTIPYVQSVIKAASGIDAALAQGKADEARLRQAEGWAYYRVIEPLIAKANTTTAQTMAGVFDLGVEACRRFGGQGDRRPQQRLRRTADLAVGRRPARRRGRRRPGGCSDERSRRRAGRRRTRGRRVDLSHLSAVSEVG